MKAEERNCARCVYLTGTGCSSWDCEFIDREDAIKAYKAQKNAVKVRHAYWKVTRNAESQCSNCGYITIVIGSLCPQCGAVMDGVRG